MNIFAKTTVSFIIFVNIPMKFLKKETAVNNHG